MVRVFRSRVIYIYIYIPQKANVSHRCSRSHPHVRNPYLRRHGVSAQGLRLPRRRRRRNRHGGKGQLQGLRRGRIPVTDHPHPATRMCFRFHPTRRYLATNHFRTNQFGDVCGSLLVLCNFKYKWNTTQFLFIAGCVSGATTSGSAFDARAYIIAGWRPQVPPRRLT